jgi:hypothetical protein
MKECLVLKELKRKSKGERVRFSEWVKHAKDCPVCQENMKEKEKQKEKEGGG